MTKLSEERLDECLDLLDGWSDSANGARRQVMRHIEALTTELDHAVESVKSMEIVINAQQTNNQQLRKTLETPIYGHPGGYKSAQDEIDNLRVDIQRLEDDNQQLRAALDHYAKTFCEGMEGCGNPNIDCSGCLAVKTLENTNV